MATWQSASGAIGYLLDVSTNDSFSSYVGGYRELDVGNVTGRVVTGLNPGITYYYRVRSYRSFGTGSYSEAMMATTVPTTGLIIHPTFDSSITNSPNAPAIEAMINRAISIYESLFSDAVTIQIYFRYATTRARRHSFARRHNCAKRVPSLRGSVEQVYQCLDSRCDDNQRQCCQCKPAGQRTVAEHRYSTVRTGERSG